MPVAGKTYDFSQENVNKAPERPGVYGLLDGDELIYYGSATKSMRDRLQSHYNGDEGPCTQGATSYKREECSNGLSRERELLQAYQNQNRRLPRCNDLIP